MVCPFGLDVRVARADLHICAPLTAHAPAKSSPEVLPPGVARGDNESAALTEGQIGGSSRTIDGATAAWRRRAHA